MAYLTSSPSVTNVLSSTDSNINSLLFDVKWGGALGAGVALTYSFPEWTATSTPTYVGYNGYPYTSEPSGSVVAGLSDSQQAAAVQAMQAWGNVANLTFTNVADTATSYGDVRLAFSSVVGAAGAAGWATPPTVAPAGGDVWLGTNSMYTYTNWNPGTFAFETLIHELGHALGLKHPFEGSPTLPAALNNIDYTLMAYASAPHNLTLASGGYSYVEPDGPMVGDIAAIQYLYGANTTYHAGDDTYTFDPTQPAFHTIWDAGGNNTISLAKYTLGCTLDLRPGHYSNLTVATPTSAPPSGYSWYDGTGALGIAYGCTIQNAVGGAGNDTIIGNDADNTITGGPGNDTIDGGAGFNTACYVGKQANFTITHSGTSIIVSDTSGAEGTDSLTNIEQLKFADGGVVYGAGAQYGTVEKVVVASVGASGLSSPFYAGVALQLLAEGMSEQQLMKLAGITSTSSIDLSAVASTGMEYSQVGQAHTEQAYRLYQAAFNRTPDFPGAAFWTHTLDLGHSLDEVANSFLQSPEFQATYGSLDTLHYVDQLYLNVLHRLPDSGGEAFWTGHLSAGDLTRAQTLSQFSESAENVANLVGVLEHGAVSG